MRKHPNSSSTSPMWRWMLAGSLCLAAASFFPLIAQKQNPPVPPKSEAVAPTPGSRIAKDPVTGEFRDLEPAEARALSGSSKSVTATSREATNAQFPLATGGFAMKVDESTMAFSVAKKTPDGKIVFECVTGKQTAEKALKLPPDPVSIMKQQKPEVQ